MFHNPLSPKYGGNPEHFFGRRELLGRFDLALLDEHSDYRTLFITGARGMGKTTLLTQLAMRASERRRRVIELGPEGTIAQLTYALGGSGEKPVDTSPYVSAALREDGVGLGAGLVSKSPRYGRECLQTMLLDACERADHGLLITLDDVEKVDVDDVSAISNAFQMASRKGHDIMLAIAGLPYAHARIIHHDGCSFMRRAPHEELGLLTWEETDEAFGDIFGHIEALAVRDKERNDLNGASYGHPYLMQLLRHYLVLLINQRATGERYVATAQDVQDAIAAAKNTFERRVLRPLVVECSDEAYAYLRTMSACLDGDRLASTDEVARRLHRDQLQLSRVRADLIDAGIIAAPEHGKVMFCISLLADYISRPTSRNPVVETRGSAACERTRTFPPST